MKKLLFSILISALSLQLFSQKELNVLFLGNSYTAVNNLPQITAELLNGTDNILNFASNTPGGFTLNQHLSNTTSMNLIMQGDWDFVVIQEQSQLPTIDYYRETLMNPAYHKLCDTIKIFNRCAMTLGYMTWGRRYGGQQCENFGQGSYCSADFVDFNHMQDSLRSAYCSNAFATNTYTAPVGMAWKKILEETDIVLHSGDDSHPTYEGSYLAACVFHAIFWNESPVGAYHSEQIDDETALILQQAAEEVVFGSPDDWNLHVDDITANFKYSIDGHDVTFTNISEGLDIKGYSWDFGDGYGSCSENPSHEFDEDGLYEVTMTAHGCRKSDSKTETIWINGMNINEITDNDLYSVVLKSNGNLIISSERGINCYVKIYDIKGQLISEDKIDNTKSSTIETGITASGIYIVKITDNTMTAHTYKVIKL